MDDRHLDSEPASTAGADTVASRRSGLETLGLGAVGLGALAGCSAIEQESTPVSTPRRTPESTPSDGATPQQSDAIRGAVYFPARAFNTYQTWADYDPAQTSRDLAFADALGLNAVRVLLSFEFWRGNRAVMGRHLDHFLATAQRQGLAVVLGLFESVGKVPTPRALRNRDIETSTAVRSPGPSVIRNRRNWDAPRRFVEWVVDRIGDHDALLALEIMNEPGGYDPRVEFCRAMLRAARDARAGVPLTMGSKTPENNRLYRDPRLDIYQFHYNLPRSQDEMRAALEAAVALAREDGVPMWLSEWQRTLAEPPSRFRPNYSSLAPVVRDSEIDGDFFWQLMLKPAYAPTQRARGRLTGLFTEDGKVYELDDARALAGGDGDGDWEVHNDWPVWVTSPPGR